MKICHMTSAHAPEDVRIFHKECVSLAQAGYEVYLVEKGDSYEKNGVHIVGIGPVTGGRLKRMLSVSRKVYETALELDADLYHFHDPELLPYGLKLKGKGKKVVFDSHEKYTEQLKRKPYLPGWCSRIIARVYGVYEKFVLKRLDGLIFPCLQNGVHPFEGQCRRITTVNNVPKLEELYDKYDRNAEKIPNSVVHIGSLTYERGITHMIQAADRAGCKAYLGGLFSPASYQEKLMQMPEYRCVEYLGKLDRQQVFQNLQKCQVGIATLLNIGQYNKYDNLATKIYEYMSLGMPVVLSRSDFNARMVKEHGFGICADPADPEEIAQAIRWLLDNPEQARQMGENGRRAVKDTFNWDVEKKKLFALYEDILKD